MHIFLSTVIGYISEPDNEIEGESPWLWTGDRRNFTGYQFFTNPDGSFRSAFHKYVLGNPKHEDLGKQSVIEKALKFYAERGLKITYAKKINNTYTWSNVSVNGTTVNYLNCLN